MLTAPRLDNVTTYCKRDRNLVAMEVIEAQMLSCSFTDFVAEVSR